MNYVNVSKQLEALMVDLMQRGVSIPQLVIDDLNSGRSLIHVYSTDPEGLDAALETSPYLQKVEMGLLMLADTVVDKDYANAWQNRISAAYMEPTQAAEQQPLAAAPSSYVSGIPKGVYWIRLKVADLTLSSGLEPLLEQFGLTMQEQPDGHLLVYGRKEDVTALIREMRRQTLENLEKSPPAP